MKASELRIGNIVGFKNRTDCYCTVQEITFAGGVQIFRFFKDGTEDDQPECVEDLTGIPLTEEWLLKFGFRKRKESGNYWFEKSCKRILFLTNDISPIKGDAFSTKLDHVFIHDINYSPRIRFVHQLQNIFWILTGTELTIK